MATVDTTADSLFAYRVSTMEELGFSTEDALRLVTAKRAKPHKEAGRTFWYDVPVTWHYVASLLDAGATHDQILRILI